MACRMGRTNPSSNTRIRLFADSGGFCQNPGCNAPLFPDGSANHNHFAEMAHIFAANDGGPRSNGELSEEDRASYSNLILLCANCHTLIDKEPETYTNDLVTAWKREHIERLSGLFGLQVFKTRQELRGAIDPLLRENRAIHQAFGPDAEYQFNPEAPEAISWKSKVRVSLIPNSNRILLLLDANSALLDEDEKAIVEQFRMHINGLISRHLDGGGEINIRFPQKMNTIACEEGA